MALTAEDTEIVKEFGLLLSHNLETIARLESANGRLIGVSRSDIHGLGYRAMQDILMGQLVLSAYGVMMGHQTAQHSIQQSMEVHMQPFEHGGKYLNHSCNGNLIVASDGRGLATFHAKRHIARGEELTYHYATTELKWEQTSDESNATCNCRSENCERTIRSFVMLNPTEQKRLIESNRVASYLINWFGEHQRKS